MFAIRSLPGQAARSAAPPGAGAAWRGARTRAGLTAETAALMQAAETHLARASEGLWEVSNQVRRGERAEALARLARSLAPGEVQLTRMAQALAQNPQGLPPRQDPEGQALRRHLAAAHQVQVLASAGARFLGAYAASQAPQEPPVLDAAWARRLCSETQAQLQQLAATHRPEDRSRAALMVASAPEALQPVLSAEDLPPDIHREARQWRQQMNTREISLPEWLALRLFAHPDSGAALALRAQERLQELDLDSSEAAAPVLRSLGRLKLNAVAAAARLPGLGLSEPLARYHLALSAEGHPPLEEVLREGGTWLVRRSLSATRDATQAHAELGLGDPPQDRLLCLHSDHAQAGPVRALRFDLFHPPGALPRDEVLLLPGQVFQVAEDGEEVRLLERGQTLRVRHYTLRKQGEETGSGLPGTLRPRVDAGLRAWELASVL